MASANVSGSWKATHPLDDAGLLTEAEGQRLDSWIRGRVYDTELAPEDAFLKLMASGTRSLTTLFQTSPVSGKEGYRYEKRSQIAAVAMACRWVQKQDGFRKATLVWPWCVSLDRKH